MKTKLKTWQLGCCLLASAIMLGSCEKKSDKETNLDYLAVQLSKGESWSIIDKDGKVVVEEEYPQDAVLSIVYDGVYWVKQDGHYQLFSLDDPKKPVSEEEYARATVFGAGVAVVSNPNEQIRFVDTKGKVVTVLDKNIKRCYPFSDEGYAVIVDINNKKGLVDPKGNIKIKPAYDELFRPTDGILMGKRNADDKAWAILNPKGEKLGEISTEKYELSNYRFSEGKIVVKNADDPDGHYIVLDETGKKIFDIKKAKDFSWDAIYKDGYLTFGNGEGKCGVADDKGEIVIRPKYDFLHNCGKGQFAAKKGDKWGIINDKDETILDFDFDRYAIMMGSNFLMMDGNSFSLMSKEGKELASFDVASDNADPYAEYIDVTAVTNTLTDHFAMLEQIQTADKTAKELGLDISNYRYSNSIGRTFNIDDKVGGDYTIYFAGNIAEEKTHQEAVNDGWFTYNRTVSDGWSWSKELPMRVSGRIESKESSISAEDLYQSLCKRLTDGRKKISEGVFSKNVKVGGKTLECRTELSLNGDVLVYDVSFNQ